MCEKKMRHLTESLRNCYAYHWLSTWSIPFVKLMRKKWFFSLPKAKHHQCFFSFHKKVSKSTGRKEQCTHWQLNKGRWIALNKHQTARRKHEMFQSFIDLSGWNLTHTKALQPRELVWKSCLDWSIHSRNLKFLYPFSKFISRHS